MLQDKPEAAGGGCIRFDDRGLSQPNMHMSDQ